MLIRRLRGLLLILPVVLIVAVGLYALLPQDVSRRVECVDGAAYVVWSTRESVAAVPTYQGCGATSGEGWA